MEQKFLNFYLEHNAFGIEQSVIKDQCYQLKLDEKGYARLGVEKMPDESAPVIGFLGCNEGSLRTLDLPYAYALRNTRIIVLDYVHYAEQLKGCHGLVLPGGSFPSPKEYYVPNADVASLPEPGMRSDAYVGCFQLALFMGIPVLGICAGAQMIAGACGGLLYPDLSYLNSPIQHKTPELHAHKVLIEPGSFLHKIVGRREMPTTSRHVVTLVKFPDNSEFEICARATDGVPEAWGVEEYNMLCIEWHPETTVLALSKEFGKKLFPEYQELPGDRCNEKIFRWFISRATAFKKTQK